MLEKYKETGPYELSLDGYNGVNSGKIQLNPDVADGFMQVADMRADILVTNAAPPRTRDYEDVGNVRVAKMLQIPRFGAKENKVVTSQFEDERWVVYVNDQELADSTIRTKKPDQTFDDAYLDSFRETVKDGLTSCVSKEKLMNHGRFSLAFGLSYIHFVFRDLAMIPLIESAALEAIANGDLARFGEIQAAVAGIYGITQVSNHIMNTIMVGMNEYEPEEFMRFISTTAFREPVVRHSVKDVLMPVIPVDRIIKGKRYLKRNVEQLILPLEQDVSEKLNDR